jgi:hypothetical protein
MYLNIMWSAPNLFVPSRCQQVVLLAKTATTYKVNIQLLVVYTYKY